MRTVSHSQLFLALSLALLPALNVRAATTLGANPGTAFLSYVKGGPLTSTKVIITPGGTTTSVYFTVNPVSLPVWLQVDKTNGTTSVAVPAALTFSPSLVAANNPAGTFTALVEIDATGVAPLTVTVIMTIANPAATITASLAISPSSNWTPGSDIPKGILTVKSTGDPVYFSVSAPPTVPGGPTWITLNAPNAVAYSWGTNINVTFTPSVFDNPTVGNILSGTILIKYGNTTLPPINVTITIGLPIATITSISPKQMPQNIPAGTVRSIAVQGNSFANGMVVKLGGSGSTPIVSNCLTFTTGTTDAWCLQSSEQFFLRLSSSTLASAASTGNQLILYLSAGAGDLPGQIAIPVVTTPIVYAVTDAASFSQPRPNQYLNVAPYEMLSIFGDNFGSFATAAGATLTVTGGRLQSAATDVGGNALKVHFTDADGNSLLADSDAYLLLWTSSQINLLVPSLLPQSNGGGELKVTVGVGSAVSQPGSVTTFTVVTASPGLLTFGGSQGVVVNAVDNSINSSTNPAHFGATILLYLSGLGAPGDGTAMAGTGTQSTAAPDGCVSLASFFQAAGLLHPGWYTFDGAVIDGAILGPFLLPPCIAPATVQVTLGNLTLSNVVTYAGFTADSIAGLYQVNVSLPLSNAPSLTGLLPQPVSSTPYPIQVSIGGYSSQTGVNVYLAK